MLQRAFTRQPSRLLRLYPLSAPASLTLTPRILSAHSTNHLTTSATPTTPIPSHRSFHTTPTPLKGITPDSSDPQPNLVGSATTVGEPAEISDQTYHERADAYINELVSKLESLQEEKDDVDCEYSVSPPPPNFLSPHHLHLSSLLSTHMELLMYTNIHRPGS